MSALLNRAWKTARDTAMRTPELVIKVREATSNEKWGPTGTQMKELSNASFNTYDELPMIVDTIFERLNDHSKNWRHVYKALLLIDYILRNGNEKFAKECQERAMQIETLKDFQAEEDGKDVGLNVRERSKQVFELLHDDQRLKEERQKAREAAKKLSVAVGSDGGYGGDSYSGRVTDDDREVRRERERREQEEREEREAQQRQIAAQAQSQAARPRAPSNGAQSAPRPAAAAPVKAAPAPNLLDFLDSTPAPASQPQQQQFFQQPAAFPQPVPQAQPYAAHANGFAAPAAPLATSPPSSDWVDFQSASNAEAKDADVADAWAKKNLFNLKNENKAQPVVSAQSSNYKPMGLSASKPMGAPTGPAPPANLFAMQPAQPAAQPAAFSAFGAQPGSQPAAFGAFGGAQPAPMMGGFAQPVQQPAMQPMGGFAQQPPAGFVQQPIGGGFGMQAAGGLRPAQPMMGQGMQPAQPQMGMQPQMAYGQPQPMGMGMQPQPQMGFGQPQPMGGQPRLF